MLVADGTVIDNRYRVCRLLGAGSFGAVYEARHLQLDRDVALKILHNAMDDEARERLIREGRILCKIRHKNVVTCYECGIWNNHAFLCTELINGNSLEELLLAELSMPLQRALQFAIQICDGLQAAHAAGAVHRDLKPSNVLVVASDDGELAKLIDFGLAKIIDPTGLPGQQLTEDGTTVGTVLYMSPEQCVGTRADERSDVYAVGCLIYHLLTGQPPFRADAAVAIMRQHMSAPIEPLLIDHSDRSADVLSVQARLQQIVDLCMAKDPAYRYQTADDVSSALKELLTRCATTGSINLCNAHVSQKTAERSAQEKQNLASSSNNNVRSKIINSAACLLPLLFLFLSYSFYAPFRITVANQALSVADRLRTTRPRWSDDVILWASKSTPAYSGSPEHIAFLRHLTQSARQTSNWAVLRSIIQTVSASREFASPPEIEAISQDLVSTMEKKLDLAHLNTQQMIQCGELLFDLEHNGLHKDAQASATAAALAQGYLDEGNLTQGEQWYHTATQLSNNNPLVCMACERVITDRYLVKKIDGRKAYIHFLKYIDGLYRARQRLPFQRGLYDYIYNRAEAIDMLRLSGHKPYPTGLLELETQKNQLLTLAEKCPGPEIKLLLTISVAHNYASAGDRENAVSYTIASIEQLKSSKIGAERPFVHAVRLLRTTNELLAHDQDGRLAVELKRIYTCEMQSPHAVERYLAYTDYITALTQARDLKRALELQYEANKWAALHPGPLAEEEKKVGAIRQVWLQSVVDHPRATPEEDKSPITQEKLNRHCCNAEAAMGFSMYRQALQEFSYSAEMHQANSSLVYPSKFCAMWAAVARVGAPAERLAGDLARIEKCRRSLPTAPTSSH